MKKIVLLLLLSIGCIFVPAKAMLGNVPVVRVPSLAHRGFCNVIQMNLGLMFSDINAAQRALDRLSLDLSHLEKMNAIAQVNDLFKVLLDLRDLIPHHVRSVVNSPNGHNSLSIYSMDDAFVEVCFVIYRLYEAAYIRYLRLTAWLLKHFCNDVVTIKDLDGARYQFDLISQDGTLAVLYDGFDVSFPAAEVFLQVFHFLEASDQVIKRVADAYNKVHCNLMSYKERALRLR